MINSNRIVPITAVDLLSMYGLILKQDSNNSSLAAVSATNPGVFAIDSASTPLIANEPVTSFDIDSDVSTMTLYFVAAFDYVGFTVDGAAATIADNDVEVNPDGHTLYKAALSNGTITITQVGF